MLISDWRSWFGASDKKLDNLCNICYNLCNKFNNFVISFLKKWNEFALDYNLLNGGRMTWQRAEKCLRW